MKYFLSIETSCDETSLAILKLNRNFSYKEIENLRNKNYVKFINSFTEVASLISSQIEIHKPFGGVVPEVGARQHADQIHSLWLELLASAVKKESFELGKMTEKEAFEKILKKIEVIFVTATPGLPSALRVGVEFAKSLQFFINFYHQNQKQTAFLKPTLVTVNHLQGHVASCFKGDYKKSDPFPHLHLLVSGGNTQLFWYENNKSMEIIGQTLDDAAGECFDKIGRMLGLPYPGGVWLSKIAALNDSNPFKFPQSMLHSKEPYFSFSGLKTSIRYFLEKQNFTDWVYSKTLSQNDLNFLVNGENLPNTQLETSVETLNFLKKVCIGVQSVIIGQLVNQTKKTLKALNPKSFGFSGGVSANLLLRTKFEREFSDLVVFSPHKTLTGDNAIMIALAGLTELDFKNILD